MPETLNRKFKPTVVTELTVTGPFVITTTIMISFGSEVVNYKMRELTLLEFSERSEADIIV